MKPYGGTLLACAVLLAALPLSGCGDPDKYSKTSDVLLTTSTDTVIVKRDVILTVRVPNPAIGEGYACDEVIEYRAEGAGFERVWYPVPGSETTRVWTLVPRKVGTLSVLARAMCAGAKEDWQYSNQIDVEVTPAEEVVPPALPTVTSVTLTATPATLTLPTTQKITVSLTAAGSTGCTLNLKYQYSGGGYSLATVNPASQGLYELPYPNPGAPPGYTVGTVTVLATGWCSENPSVTRTATATVAIN